MKLHPSPLPTCLALSTLLFACGSPPAPESPAPSRKPGGAASVAPPSASPSPATSGSTAQPVVPASPLLLITELSGDADFFPLGPKAFVSDGRHLLTIEGDDLIFDPAMMSGIEARSADNFWRIDRMGGAWPESAFLSVMLPEERTGFSQIYRWTGAKWVAGGRSWNSESTTGFAAWSEGRSLAMHKAGMATRVRFEVVAGKKGGPLPTPTEARPDEEHGFCITRVNGEAFAALPSGEVFLAGVLCDVDKYNAVVERWAPGQSKGVIDPLPGVPSDDYFEVDALLARSPTEVYLMGHVVSEKQPRPYLARFDGSRWTEERAPMSRYPAGLWVGPDGVLWTASLDRIWSRAPGAAWVPMSLPESAKDGSGALQVQRVWPRGPGDVWVLAVGPSSGRAFLMHTRPATRAINLPDREEIAEEVRTRSMPAPLGPGCETPFVLLYTVGKSAPADYDFPATRAALKGQRQLAAAELVEVKRLDKRYLGARVPSVELAKKLADFIKLKVPGSTPQTACYNPKAARALDLDFVTGELRKK